MAKRTGNKKAHKSTQSEMLKRVDLVLKLMLSGVTRRRDIFQYIAKNDKINWQVTARTLDGYMQKATEWIKAQANIDGMKELGKSLLQCDMLYMNALKVQDYKTCLQIIKERATLLGIKAPEKIGIDIKGEISLEKRIEGMTDEEIKKTFEEINSRLTQAGIGIKRTKETGAG